jgi:hypothetical protein
MWLNSFYVMMWYWQCSWPGLGGGGSMGRRRGRAAAEARAHRRSGLVVLVHKSEIGGLGSTSGSQRCSSSTGSGLGGSVGS